MDLRIRKPSVKRPRYRGRFAPSPTGLLHFGSLVAALGSYLDARQHGGEWWLRIDDVDETRNVPGAEDAIRRALEMFGFEWDGEIIRQTERKERYQTALATLTREGFTYPCICSRRDIARIAMRGREGMIYPGTCRTTPPAKRPQHAVRLKTAPGPITFSDRIAGTLSQDLVRDVGDFVVFRTDGFTAYQLAVVVDDAVDEVTHVVRGEDLLWSTPRQIYLQRLLGLETPVYAHLPLVRDSDGKKLSKGSSAFPVRTHAPTETLLRAWSFLGQSPPEETTLDLEEFWRFATGAWSVKKLSRTGLAR